MIRPKLGSFYVIRPKLGRHATAIIVAAAPAAFSSVHGRSNFLHAQFFLNICKDQPRHIFMVQGVLALGLSFYWCIMFYDFFIGESFLSFFIAESFFIIFY